MEANNQGRTPSNMQHVATSDDFELVPNKKTPSIDPSCTFSAFYRTLGVNVHQLPDTNFLYERKTNKQTTQNNCNIASHISLRTSASDVSMKLFNFKTDFTRTIDSSNVTLQSSLDYLLVTRNPPYTNFFLDHRHRKSSESSKKGPAMLPPALDINNKIHFVVDTNKLFPDIPGQFACDILSDLDFQLLNKINFKLQFNSPHHQRSGLFTYHAQVDKVTHGHVFSGTSKSELQLDNKQIQVTDSPKSLITFYGVKLKAPKHKLFQLMDLDVKALCNGNDIATHSSLNAQYNPQSISQVSAIISTKFYGKEFQNSLYALFKQHQGIVRFFLNTTDNQDYAYEMDIGLDTDLLTEHTKRTNEQETAMSDIDTKKCTATGKYYRCYKGDITVRTGTSIVRRVKGKFNVNVERQGLPAIISSMDLNRFTDERIGYATALNFSTREIETTYYTLVTSWNMKHQFGKLSAITAKQKDQEVLRITASTADFAGYKIRFLAANIELKEINMCVLIDISRSHADSKSNTVSLSEAYPQQRDYITRSNI
ncbi:unnamed protein product [Rotaria socialis]|uniref:Uncharacterized protein n=1 Tax=Rotaria socialis TaxID=392032 RepID=A0A821E2T5_9BILA|nr:unnamed protein product [Rotaria socialis]